MWMFDMDLPISVRAEGFVVSFQGVVVLADIDINVIICTWVGRSRGSLSGTDYFILIQGCISAPDRTRALNRARPGWIIDILISPRRPTI